MKRFFKKRRHHRLCQYGRSLLWARFPNNRQYRFANNKKVGRFTGQLSRDFSKIPDSLA